MQNHQIRKLAAILKDDPSDLKARSALSCILGRRGDQNFGLPPFLMIKNINHKGDFIVLPCAGVSLTAASQSGYFYLQIYCSSDFSSSKFLRIGCSEEVIHKLGPELLTRVRLGSIDFEEVKKKFEFEIEVSYCS